MLRPAARGAVAGSRSCIDPEIFCSDNGLVFTSRSYAAPVKSYGLQQEFITPYSPEQNGMVERVIRTLKDQCD